MRIGLLVAFQRIETTFATVGSMRSLPYSSFYYRHQSKDGRIHLTYLQMYVTRQSYIYRNGHGRVRCERSRRA
jgi:hypothetical protein